MNLKIYFCSFVIAAAAYLVPCPHVQAKNILIATPRGPLTNCPDAAAFRDGPLYEDFEQFANAFNAEKEAGIQRGLAEFDKDRRDLERALVSAKEDQVNIVRIALAQIAASYVIKGVTNRVLDKFSAGAPAAQIQVMKDVVGSVNGVKQKVFFAVAKDQAGLKKFDGTSILQKQAGSFVMSKVIAAGRKGAGGPVVAIASHVYTVGSVAIPAIADYKLRDLDIQVARDDIENIKKHVANLMRKSVKLQLDKIEQIKRQIDEQCGDQEEEPQTSEAPASDLDDFEKELSGFEKEIDAKSKRKAASKGRAPALNDLLAQAQRNYRSQMRALEARSQRRMLDATAAAIESGLTIFADSSYGGNSTNQGCSENVSGRAPHHCCVMVEQQIAEYRRAYRASPSAQQRQVLNEGIRYNQRWHSAHCR